MEPQTSTSTRPILKRPQRRGNIMGFKTVLGACAFFSIFAFSGLGALYGAYYLADDSLTFLRGGRSAPGVVVDLHYHRDSDGGGTYRPEVEYTAEGSTYRFVSNSGSNPASFDRGEAVEILYMPGNPQDARINAFFALWGGALICGVVGSVFALVGFGFMYGAIKARQVQNWLIQHGQRISADVSHVTTPEEKRQYYTIVAQWHNPRDNTMYVFASEPISFDPREFVKENIEVLINPKKPTQYLMDTGFLPKTSY